METSNNATAPTTEQVDLFKGIDNREFALNVLHAAYTPALIGVARLAIHAYHGLSWAGAKCVMAYRSQQDQAQIQKYQETAHAIAANRQALALAADADGQATLADVNHELVQSLKQQVKTLPVELKELRTLNENLTPELRSTLEMQFVKSNHSWQTFAKSSKESFTNGLVTHFVLTAITYGAASLLHKRLMPAMQCVTKNKYWSIPRECLYGNHKRFKYTNNPEDGGVAHTFGIFDKCCSTYFKANRELVEQMQTASGEVIKPWETQFMIDCEKDPNFFICKKGDGVITANFLPYNDDFFKTQR